ncbi:hypothetical protein AC579_10299 [Pseudocercospora musae]|uniref:Uncharacterized protein n=1 Tax=Pseudocercospora musae TaxID=113226 RepID=A0A139GTZ5_9PEZI|nr:hypothetical protein AC579_10299 [Pseudocercospora musae]
MASKLEEWANLSLQKPISRRPYHVGAGVLFVTLTIFAYILIGHTSTASEQDVATQFGVQSDLFNRTLGFQKVFAIGLPGRTDKRDMMTLSAGITGLDIEWWPGIMGEDVPKKAIPAGWKQAMSLLGSWRAHMNVLDHIIENHLQSALSLKMMLTGTIPSRLKCHRVNLIQDQDQDSSTNSTRSPYGTGWDLLWPGHCKSGPSEAQQPIYFLENDITVPPTSHRHSRWAQPHVMPEVETNSTRLVYRQKGGSCTFAYAVTQAGARKLVASLRSNVIPYDSAVSEVCAHRGGHIQPFDCFSTYPPLISTHRPAGTSEHDSDISPDHQKGKMHEEYTWDIVFSVKQNIDRLVSGERMIKSQWPDETISSERNIDDEELQPTGRLEIVNVAEMPKHEVKVTA